MKKKQKKLEPGSFEDKYPHIVEWLMGDGLVEIGRIRDGYTNSFTRALDEGGMIYEDDTRYETMDETLQALDNGIKKWLDTYG